MAFLTIEVPLFLSSFCMILQGPIITNLYMYRACYVILEYNETQCAELGNENNDDTHHLEPLVQPTVNQINMVHSVINTGIPLIFCLFVGTWSDMFGRKPFLVLSFAGNTLSMVVTTLFIHFTNVSPWWFIFSSIPSLLTGGFSVIMILISAHITDVTTEKNRVVRLAILEIIFATSSVFGNLTSSYLLYATSYQTIYIICTSLTGCSFLYTLLFIPESKKGEKKPFSLKEIINSINIKEIVKYTVRKRENNARFFIFWMIGINVLFGLAMGGMSLSTMFLRRKLSWTLSHLTKVNSVTSVGNIIGTIFSTYVLYKRFKFKEIPLTIFGLILQLVEYVLRGIATNDYYIYAAYAIGIFNGLPHLMLRTIMSYIVPPEEMGKIFALISIVMSIDMLISNLFYPLIYNATIYTYPGLFNFVSFGFTFLGGILVVILGRLLPERKPLEESQQANESKKPSISVNNFEISGINDVISAGIALDIDTRRLSQAPSLY